MRVDASTDARSLARLRWLLGFVGGALILLAVALTMKWRQGLPPYGIAPGVIAWRLAWSLVLATGVVLLAILPMRQLVRLIGSVLACAAACDMLLESGAWMADVTGWPERHAVQQADRVASIVCRLGSQLGRSPTAEELAAMMQSQQIPSSHWTLDGRRVEFRVSIRAWGGDPEALSGALGVGEIACAFAGREGVECVVGVPGADGRGPRLARESWSGNVAIARAGGCR